MHSQTGKTACPALRLAGTLHTIPTGKALSKLQSALRSFEDGWGKQTRIGNLVGRAAVYAFGRSSRMASTMLIPAAMARAALSVA